MEDKYYSRLIKMMVFVFDFYLISLAFSLAKKLGFDSGIAENQETSFFLIFSLIWVISGFLNEIYNINKFSQYKSIISSILGALLLHFCLLMVVLFATHSYQIDTSFLPFVYLSSATFLLISRIVYKLTWRYFEFSGFDQRKVIIVGATHSGRALYDFFESHDFSKYNFKGFFDDSPDPLIIHRALIKGKFSEVAMFCLKENIDEIYFALPPGNETLLNEISKFADDNFIYLRITPDFGESVSDKYNVFMLDSIPVLTTRKEPLGVALNVWLKRLFDIVFSLTVILTVFPVLFPIIALAIKLDSKGPIFFKQPRQGKKNKLFDCYKFRTMYVGASPVRQATKDDPRITRVGRFLRKTNLDEIPQFINALMGNMSVVGPRPHISSQLEQYGQAIKKYKIRHFVTPGITGYAQVNGFRGETKEVKLMEKRVEYDVTYMENWSLSLDIKIIFLTVWNMIRGEKSAY
ncbi:MAG: undecaprenyl-phosphate glucose phosphotransferase [Cyclobacteriaceae bacterium]|nr:undecaprenyl-phosphate glucose phosphotransferase [Cyclobacteriaceae bacterium]MDH4295085.1 undecaprenyl-phosphate glucose phosphotransferase [Cyclobacteriaceae bacterium]MDH5248869.1 undecaprenyl-phosphate glucose phosphotransferase [Cyclobacteriaceae bacterium]